jgi:hypothetical protein
MRVPLVNAYEECLSGDADVLHGAEASDSCANGPPESPFLRTGTAGSSGGAVKLEVICTNAETVPCPAAGDQEDVRLTIFQTDVRCATAGYGCTSANQDYSGPLLLKLPVRITDHYNRASSPVPCTDTNGASPCITATTVDAEFGVSVPCTPVGPATAPGSNCTLTTTMDAVATPDFVTEFQRASVRAFEDIDLQDAGADEVLNVPGCPFDCGTGDENGFVAQGILAP